MRLGEEQQPHAAQDASRAGATGSRQHACFRRSWPEPPLLTSFLRAPIAEAPRAQPIGFRGSEESRGAPEALARKCENLGLRHRGRGGYANYERILACKENALEQIKPLDWHAIHDDRFFCTAPGLYDEMIPKAEELGAFMLDNEQRRARRLERALAQMRCEEECDSGKDEEEPRAEPIAPICPQD